MKIERSDNSIGGIMKKIGLTILLALALAASFATTSSEAAGVHGVDLSAQPAGTRETVNFSPTSMTGLTYVVDEGPSEVRSFVITASSMQGLMLRVSGPGTFPISDNPDNGFVKKFWFSFISRSGWQYKCNLLCPVSWRVEYRRLYCQYPRECS